MTESNQNGAGFSLADAFRPKTEEAPPPPPPHMTRSTNSFDRQQVQAEVQQAQFIPSLNSGPDTVAVPPAPSYLFGFEQPAQQVPPPSMIDYQLHRQGVDRAWKDGYVAGKTEGFSWGAGQAELERKLNWQGRVDEPEVRRAAVDIIGRLTG